MVFAAVAVVVSGALAVTGLRSAVGSTTPVSAPPSTGAPSPPPRSSPSTTVPSGGPSGGPSSGPSASPSASPTATTPVTTAPAPNPSSVPVTAPVSPPAPQLPSGVVFQYESAATATTVSQLASDPAAFAGKSVSLTGVITNFVVNESGGATAMYVGEPGNPSTVVYVQFSQYDDVTHLDTGDTVTVWGDATGGIAVPNTLGEPVNVTNVYQVYLSDITSGYQDTNDPSPS